jgi:hypothetical protein
MALLLPRHPASSGIINQRLQTSGVGVWQRQMHRPHRLRNLNGWRGSSAVCGAATARAGIDHQAGNAVQIDPPRGHQCILARTGPA